MLCFSSNYYFSKNTYNIRSYSTKLSKKKAVILTQTIDGIGEKGEELIVKNGYARNYLFPKNYAVLSTKETREEYKEFADVSIFYKRGDYVSNVFY